MFSGFGWLISAHMQRRYLKALRKSQMPRVVWGTPHIPRVPRKAP